MKNIIIFILLFLIFACSPNKKMQKFINANKINVSKNTENSADIKTKELEDLAESNSPNPNLLIETESDQIFNRLDRKNNLQKFSNDLNIIDSKIIDSTKQNIKTNTGLVAYSIPENMQIGQDYDIKIRISKDTSNSEKHNLIIGENNIPINTIEKSVIIIENIRVSSIMSATLTSEPDDFKITSLSTDIQDIEKTGYTEWEWTVMPLRSGENPLKMIVKVRIKTDGEDVFKDIVVFEKNFKIQSNWFYSIEQFLINYWQWIMSSVCFPIFLWFYKRKKKKKKK